VADGAALQRSKMKTIATLSTSYTRAQSAMPLKMNAKLHKTTKDTLVEAIIATLREVESHDVKNLLNIMTKDNEGLLRTKKKIAKAILKKIVIFANIDYKGLRSFRRAYWVFQAKLCHAKLNDIAGDIRNLLDEMKDYEEEQRIPSRERRLIRLFRLEASIALYSILSGYDADQERKELRTGLAKSYIFVMDTLHAFRSACSYHDTNYARDYSTGLEIAHQIELLCKDELTVKGIAIPASGFHDGTVLGNGQRGCAK